MGSEGINNSKEQYGNQNIVMKNTSIAIIGAGLSGLTLAYRLRNTGLEVSVLEARDRPGGRIFTFEEDDEPPLDMGATWLGKKHGNLIGLLQELGLEITEQYMGERAYYEPISTSPPQLVTLPPNDEPSYRIAEGSSRLIEALVDSLESGDLIMGEAVLTIQNTRDTCLVKTTDRSLEVDHVVITIPPKLFVESIKFDPSLPGSLVETAKKTHTWMAESIKFGLSYPEPFWKENNISGTLFSNTGPIPEMYDHSATTGSGYALKGFLKDAYHTVSEEERKRLVLKKLESLYGEQALSYLSYRETVWRHEPFTFAEYGEPILPHQNNGNPIFKQSYWDGKLLLSGSETASEFPGYMDGAVESANRTAETIKLHSGR